MSTARNDPCPCGSGVKYKKCCLAKGDQAVRRRSRLGVQLSLAVIGLAAILYFAVGSAIASIVGVVGLVGVGSYLLFSDPPSGSGPGSPGAINFGR